MEELFLFVLEKGTCDLHVEEFDQRSHEESGDDGTDSDEGRDVSPLSAADHEDGYSESDTDEIGDDPDVFELAPFPLL